MASRMREDEKNEKIIRGLMKLPANKRCINCNNLGPQYVCTNFWTFICTTCSGIHREFTHRVKSISMAKFTSQEVSALQEGGNENAKAIFFKEWDPQRHSLPDSSNVDKLRDFIKHVYVDRRYTGERGADRPPRVKGDREDYHENRREDSYRGDSKSPPYGDTYERRYGERPSSDGRYDDRNVRLSYGERSPGFDQSNYRRSPGYFEVVDDRRRDDRFGNENHQLKFEDRRSPDATEKPGGRSPNSQGASSPPVLVRPVREILGDDAPRLRVGDLPKPNGIKVPNNSSKAQRTTSSSSLGSTEGTSVEIKKANDLGSLIDFSSDPEPPASAAPQSDPNQTTLPSNNAGDWASFDLAGQSSQQTTSNMNPLESALSQLAATVPTAAGNSSVSVDSWPKSDAGQWQSTQQQQTSLFSAAGNQLTSPPLNGPTAGASRNQAWATSLPPNMQGPAITTGTPSQGAIKLQQEVKEPDMSQPSDDFKASRRKELPADLFTALYPPAPVAYAGWQRGPQFAMHYGMQYPAVAPMQFVTHMPTAAPTPKSTNPFDLGNEPNLSHASSFPSMASLQGALPSQANHSPLMRSVSFGAPTTQWVSPQQASIPAANSASPYMVQQTPLNMAQLTPNHMGQQAGGFGNNAFSGMDQGSAASFSQMGSPNSYAPTGGNPFG